MDFKNLYALLKIKPTASQSDIAKAMRQAAQQQTITLDDLKLCKQYLLNEEARNKYDERLFAAYPELLAPPPPLEPKPEPEPDPEKAEEAKPLLPASPIQKKKKLYLILAIAAAAIVLIAGTVAYFKHFKPIAEAKEAVRNLLKDPDSAKFYDVEKHFNTHNKETYVCGEVNARAPAGGYVGKKIFVHNTEKKVTLIIPATKPKELREEFYYSISYRVACLNADLEKITADMDNYNNTLEKLVSLQRDRLNSNSDEEQERLDKAIATTKAKSDEEWANITIFTDSDDD